MEEAKTEIKKSKIKEMFLYKANEFEIEKKLKNEDINNISLYKYYLLPKEWIENYKNKYDYNSIIQQLNYLNLELNDFSKFKSHLENNFESNIKNINIEIKKDVKLSPPDKKYFTNINYEENKSMAFPRNFILIKEELFKEYINIGLNFKLYSILYDIYFFKDKIYLDFKNNYIFMCSYDENAKFFNINKLIKYYQEIDIIDKIKYIIMNNQEYYDIFYPDINNDINLYSIFELGKRYMDSKSLKSSHIVYNSNNTQFHINTLKENSDIQNDNNNLNINNIQFSRNSLSSNNNHLINNNIINRRRNFIYNFNGNLYSYFGDINNSENNIKISFL